MTIYKKVTGKIKRYYTNAYKTNFYPSFSELFSSKKDILAYYGFLGDNNFGDEWVQQAAKELFKEQTLLPIQDMMPLRGIIIKKLFSHKIKGIVIGGGTLIGPRFWFESDFKALKNKNKPVFVHGTGVHKLPEFSKNWEFMFKDGIFGGVRGFTSVENLAQQSTIKAKVVGDAAFAMFDNKQHKGSGKKVLVNLGTHAPYAGEATAREAIRKFVGYLIENNYEPVFYPFHEEDIIHANQLKKEFGQLEVLGIPSYYHEVVEVFRNAIFAVGERLHFTVMALMAGCPLYAVNYGKKHYDMLESLEAGNFGHVPDNINFEAIRQAFENRETQDFTQIFSHIQNFKSIQTEESKKFLESCNKHTL
jgi:polysaccharide pyruvyl transferase WcaK-like protein